MDDSDQPHAADAIPACGTWGETGAPTDAADTWGGAAASGEEPPRTDHGWGAADAKPAGDMARAAEEPDAASVAEEALTLASRPSAPELQRALAARLAADPAGLAIDASRVEKLPMPAIQVLLAAAGELAGAGGRLRVRNPSFSFGLAFEALGFIGEREIFTVEYC